MGVAPTIGGGASAATVLCPVALQEVVARAVEQQLAQYLPGELFLSPDRGTHAFLERV